MVKVFYALPQTNSYILNDKSEIHNPFTKSIIFIDEKKKTLHILMCQSDMWQINCRKILDQNYKSLRNDKFFLVSLGRKEHQTVKLIINITNNLFIQTN